MTRSMILLVPLVALVLLAAQPVCAQAVPPPAGYYDVTIGFWTWQIDIFANGDFSARWPGQPWEDGVCRFTGPGVGGWASTTKIRMTRRVTNFAGRPGPGGVMCLYLYDNGVRISRLRQVGP